MPSTWETSSSCDANFLCEVGRAWSPPGASSLATSAADGRPSLGAAPVIGAPRLASVETRRSSRRSCARRTRLSVYGLARKMVPPSASPPDRHARATCRRCGDTTGARDTARRASAEKRSEDPTVNAVGGGKRIILSVQHTEPGTARGPPQLGCPGPSTTPAAPAALRGGGGGKKLGAGVWLYKLYDNWMTPAGLACTGKSRPGQRASAADAGAR
jgi:hypothetical protein